jgi:hypothetical protein
MTKDNFWDSLGKALAIVTISIIVDYTAKEIKIWLIKEIV